jgi:hypothetical protein
LSWYQISLMASDQSGGIRSVDVASGLSWYQISPVASDQSYGH